jgi:hypothetical protein
VGVDDDPGEMPPSSRLRPAIRKLACHRSILMVETFWTSRVPICGAI